MNVTIKLAGMLVILLVGVVLGIQTAERGIYKVEGVPDKKTQAFYITKIDKGKVEMAVMGEKVRTEPEAVVNYVSKWGMSVGGMVKEGARTVIDWLAGLFRP